MSPLSSPTIELCLFPPEKCMHCRFYFPGCQLKGRIFFSRLRINTLYTALVRHKVKIRLAPPASKKSTKDFVTQGPAKTFQFMCVTKEQKARLPCQVTERINLHQVDTDSPRDFHQVLESFSLTISLQCPSSFSCQSAFCKNFVEVKYFSSEFGFQKALFAINVQKASTPLPSSITMKKGLDKHASNSNFEHQHHHVSKHLSRGSWCFFPKPVLRFSLRCPASVFVCDKIPLSAEFRPLSSWSGKGLNGRVFAELQCLAKIRVEGEDTETWEEVVVQNRHCLGGLVKERSATKLEAVMSLDRCHPHSGHQTWTPKEIHHQPQVMSMSITCRTVLKLILENADETSSQLLVSAVVDVKPQRIHLSTEAEGAKEPKPPSRNQKSERREGRDRGETGDEHEIGEEPDHMVEAENNIDDETKQQKDGSSDDGSTPVIDCSRFDIDLDQVRTAKVFQNGEAAALTPANSPQKSPPQRSVHRQSKKFRNIFLGLLKMRYAAGDKSIVNYKEEEHKDCGDDEWSSDSYSNGDGVTSRRHSLRRRLKSNTRRRQKHSETATNDELQSGELSLYSDDDDADDEVIHRPVPSLGAPHEKSSIATPTDVCQPDLCERVGGGMTFHHSLPGSVSDIPAHVAAVNALPHRR